MKKIAFYLSIMLIGAFSTISCNDQGDNKSCDDVECGADEICEKGECVPNEVDPCKDVSCNPNQHCENGECVPNEVDLCKDVSCDPNQHCEKGECVDNTENPCKDVSCEKGQRCVGGTCVDSCTGIVCIDNHICKNGECVLDNDKLCENVTCTTGFHCSAGECVKIDPCDDVLCDPGFVCQLGNCYDKAIFPCLGVTCPDDQVCESGVCVVIDEHVEFEEPVGNVVPNWDFEEWELSSPTSWHSFGIEVVVSKNTSNPKSKLAAVNINNPLKNNARLESIPLTLDVGKYYCSAWLKGEGTVLLGARLSDTDNPSKGKYKYNSETVLNGSGPYKEVFFNFTVDATIQKVTILITVKNTSGMNVNVDAISCVRAAGNCDNVTCKEWEECREYDGSCRPKISRCNTADDCSEWQTCDANHYCVLAEGRCKSTVDCDENSDKPKCDVKTKICVAGDPCEGVTCDEWKTCQRASGLCVLDENRCITSKDCLKDKPACDVTTHTCQDSTHDCNIFPNGGFEKWDDYYIPYHGDNYLPDFWYGLFDHLWDNKYNSEIDPKNIKQYTTSVHSGNYAMQIIFTEFVADRLASDEFDIPPGAYTCSYWVRGKGTLRHRSYSSGGESPYTDFYQIDTDKWQRVEFNAPGNVREFRLILYVSQTDASKDHVQIDDVVCTKN